MAVSTEELKKAIHSLEEAIQLYIGAKDSSQQKAFRDACIQRFEYGIELSWKVSMKVLGSNISAAKPGIREMARNQLIEDPQIWFDFIEARNESSHSYDEEVAKKVYEVAKKLPAEAHKLLSKLNQK